MDTRRTDKKGTDRLQFTFVAAAVLLGALLCGKVARSRVEPSRARDLVNFASARKEHDPNSLRPYRDKARETAEALKKRNLFVKEQTKQHPVKQVEGILGDEVLIGDDWYRLGGKIADAEVVLIEPTEVTIEWDGQKKRFAPMASSNGTSSEPSKRPRQESTRTGKVPSARSVESPKEPDANAVEVAAEDDPLAWIGVDLPPGVRAKMMEKWNTASDQEKAEARRQWENMPQEQKEQAIEAMSRM